MHVTRIGFTPVKGGRHRARAEVELTHRGPRGDRTFCLVDPGTDRCLRTVDNPSLLATIATWDGRELGVTLPEATVVAEPVPTGEVRVVDYWGRAAEVRVVDGPWAAAYAGHLGREVLLARSRPGEVVYGAGVTLVTSASLAGLGEELRATVDAARFRATFTLDVADLAPRAEEEWVGRTVRIGEAEVRIRTPVPRCAVVDLDPATGVRDLAVLEALARRRDARGVVFGVDADVVVPGRVVSGDRATLVTG